MNKLILLFLQLKHSEEVVGGFTSTIVTPASIMSGLADSMVKAVAVALISGIIGTAAAFFTKRYLSKKFPSSTLEDKQNQ